MIYDIALKFLNEFFGVLIITFYLRTPNFYRVVEIFI